MSERKGWDDTMEGVWKEHLALIDEMFRMTGRMLPGVSNPIEAALRDAREHVEAQAIALRERDQGYRFSDRRPLDAKTVPGAHNTYR